MMFHIGLSLFLSGGSGLIWSILWIVAIEDSPLTHPRIAKQEKRYIALALSGQTTFHGKQVFNSPKPLMPLQKGVYEMLRDKK